MSKGLEVSGVRSDAKAATYVYTLSADSGYRANETGRISADRHGLVCRALAGKLDDYDQLAEQRAELLEALIRAEKRLRKLSDIDCGCRPCRGVCRTGRGAEAELEGRMETAAEYADETLKAIANATQQRNATGGEG